MKDDSRRRFIKNSSVLALGATVADPLRLLESDIQPDRDAFFFESKYIKLKLSEHRPQFEFFSTDSLGNSDFKVNPVMMDSGQHENDYRSRARKGRIEYFCRQQNHKASWTVDCQSREFTISSTYSTVAPDPFRITFSQPLNHCTVLGEMPAEKSVRFPCLLHFPGMGTFRISCNDPGVYLFYDADRTAENPFVRISLQGADLEHEDLVYSFRSVTVFPDLNIIRNDRRLNGLKKNFINTFQINPRIRCLANNSASDACAFTLFLYTEIARHTPPLTEGLTAMNLVRNSLSRYLDGMIAYGQVGYHDWFSTHDALDSAPSLILSACYYINDSKDLDWAKNNYDRLKTWVADMLRTDKNNDGLIEYGYSGNSGTWDGRIRPANWWDAVGFGHDDAYSNAVAYQALLQFVKVAALLNKDDDEKLFAGKAAKLKNKYYDHFFNSQTGVLAGWKSEDGKLHDYYFTFVNSVAIYYGLIDEDRAKTIMQRLLAKMKEVGFTDFRLGIPGNLVPIDPKDYTDFDKRWGYDSFEVYENGGASACFAYYFVKSLYQLGMVREANNILVPMLESLGAGGFEGHCANSEMSRDWKTWKGECWGYEGFLVDNYLVQLAILDYENHHD